MPKILTKQEALAKYLDCHKESLNVLSKQMIEYEPGCNPQTGTYVVLTNDEADELADLLANHRHSLENAVYNGTGEYYYIYKID